MDNETGGGGYNINTKNRPLTEREQKNLKPGEAPDKGTGLGSTFYDFFNPSTSKPGNSVNDPN